MNTTLEWTTRPHRTYLSFTAGYPRGSTMDVGTLDDYEVQVLEGDRGVSLTVYIEPQRPPNYGPSGIAAIYGRRCIALGRRVASVDEAKAYGSELVLAHREGRLDVEPDPDCPDMWRSVIRDSPDEVIHKPQEQGGT